MTTTASYSELTNEQLLARYTELKRQRDVTYNLEQAHKLFLNSVYGAQGNQYFLFYNRNVAEAVTLFGQHLIKYTARVLENYFREQWPVDHELHAQLGITGATAPVEPVVIYGDTDSCYVGLGEVLRGVSWSTPVPTEIGARHQHHKQFIHRFYELRLAPHLTACFEAFAQELGTENLMNFEMETISSGGIWLGKKHYVLDLSWEDPVDFDPHSKFVYKGVEIIKTETPPFARKALTHLVNYIFRQEGDFKLPALVHELRRLREEFNLQGVQEISGKTSVNKYRDYVLNDQSSLDIRDGANYNVKAAAHYNYLLYNSRYRNKYQPITSSDKIRWYHCLPNPQGIEVFAYLHGAWPVEFAPRIDLDVQFGKMIVEKINRFVTALGYQPIPQNLLVTRSVLSLFQD